MKKLIFVTLMLALAPTYAQYENESNEPGKLEIRQSQKDLTEEYRKKLEAEKDPDSKYLPMNRFINSGRRR